MGRNYNMMTVSKEKCVKELKKRKLTMCDVSRELGHSKHFIANGLDQGRFTQSTVKMLETLYNIKYDDIKQNGEPEQIEMEISDIKKAGIDLKELYDVIYEAVKSGIIDAFK